MFRFGMLGTALVLFCSGIAHAQTSSLFGNNSALGATSSARGASASAFGGTGAGGAGGGVSSGTGPTINAQAGVGGVDTNIGTGGFIGRSDSAGRFVGSGQAGQQRVQGGPNRFGGRGNIGNFQQRQDSERKVIRPRARIAFNFAKLPQQTVQKRLTDQVRRIAMEKPVFKNVSLHPDDTGTVAIRGTVESNADARLVAALIRLEPGVRRIENELTVLVADESSEE